MITRTIVFGDVHIPFEDKKALALTLDVAEHIKVDRIIINGDLLDFYAVNMHGPSHPDVSQSLEDELVAGREFFETLRKRFPDVHIVFNEGNHENRLDRFMLKNSKQLWGLLSVKNYLELEKHNIEFYPYNNKYQIEESNCFVMHSPPSYGVNGARTSLLKKLNQTFIYGCTHRVQHACATAGDGEVFDCYYNGWLGDSDSKKENREVFSYQKGHNSWQKSFIVVTIIDGVEHHINSYNIRHNKVVVDGYLHEAA